MVHATFQSAPAKPDHHPYVPRVHGGAASSETLDVEMLERRRSPVMHVQSGCQRVGMPGLGSLPLTDLQIRPTNADFVSTPLLIKFLSLASPTRYLDWNQKGEEVKRGRAGSLKPGRLNLSCEANKMQWHRDWGPLFDLATYSEFS